MLQRLASLWPKRAEDAPVRVLTTKENVMIIQLHPKKQVVTVSYKGEVKTARFTNNVIKRMLKGGLDFEANTFEVLGAAARLIAQIIKYNKYDA